MNALNSLNHAELRRYGKHLILPEVGLVGQQKLKAAAVLLVGAGGLGSPAALYLAAAGIGRLGIIDHDEVDESNLQRQILHGTSMLGTKKVASAQARLQDINPHITLEIHDTRLNSTNALALLCQYDIIVDGSDNFATRYLVNDACALLGRPNVYASVLRFTGQITLFDAKTGPCYRCLYPEPPAPEEVPSCAEGGVLGVLPGVLGVLQATEVIKLVIGIGAPLRGRLLLFDALSMHFREIAVHKDAKCALCGAAPTITALLDETTACAAASTKKYSQAMSELKLNFTRQPTNAL